jgi:hypothetical protein
MSEEVFESGWSDFWKLCMPLDALSNNTFYHLTNHSWMSREVIGVDNERSP